MKEQFVTYEIALALKELGFNDFHRFGWYIIEDGTEFGKSLHVSGDEAFYFDTEYCIKAPLWQQVIDWFRTIHKFAIAVTIYRDVDNDSVLYDYVIYDSEWMDFTSCRQYDSYEDAREAAVLMAIELLKGNKGE